MNAFLRNEQPGKSQHFVIARGFRELFGEVLLVDADGCGRAFVELTSDPDHPGADPEAAFEQALSALQPGGEIRLIQIAWPDPGPRGTFLRQVQAWERPPANPVLSGFADDLIHHIAHAPLPFFERTFLEAVIRSKDSLEWLAAAAEQFAAAGIDTRRVPPGEVQQLAHRILHPELF